jgi:hypothetical protein
MSVTPYVMCGAGSCIQVSPLPPLCTLPIYSIYSLPRGPGERRTALSVNAAPYEGCRPASGARLLDRALRCGPGLSLLGILLEGPKDTLRSLPGSAHRPPDGGLHRGPGQSWLGILLKGPQDALRFLSSFMHCPGSFLCVPLSVVGAPLQVCPM